MADVRLIALAVVVAASTACLTAPVILPPSSALAHDDALLAGAAGGTLSADGAGAIAALALRSPPLTLVDDNLALHAEIVADAGLLGGNSLIADASFFFAAFPSRLAARGLVDVTPMFTSGVEVGAEDLVLLDPGGAFIESGPTIGIPIAFRWHGLTVFSVPRVGLLAETVPAEHWTTTEPVRVVDGSLGFGYARFVVEVGLRAVIPARYVAPEYLLPYATLTYDADLVGTP